MIKSVTRLENVENIIMEQQIIAEEFVDHFPSIFKSAFLLMIRIILTTFVLIFWISHILSVLKVALPRVHSSSETLLYFLLNNNTIQSDKEGLQKLLEPR
jgi:hypothetical protein